MIDIRDWQPAVDETAHLKMVEDRIHVTAKLRGVLRHLMESKLVNFQTKLLVEFSAASTTKAANGTTTNGAAKASGQPGAESKDLFLGAPLTFPSPSNRRSRLRVKKGTAPAVLFRAQPR